MVIEKTTKELILFIKNRGRLSQFNQDVDKLYTYLYQNKLQSKISGPTIGLFYSKEEGDYIAGVALIYCLLKLKKETSLVFSSDREIPLYRRQSISNRDFDSI